ncbi:sensor domain-containing diguanylate cyclase [Devosia sp. A16]|uniref:sensor domain-containing diguanylate cyclase n=1 Tax=Devosia sp. A16 TaxID=1736675 RepID=UPI0006D7E41A|nr:diguanylate cyclase [Devosia sp. A16]
MAPTASKSLTRRAALFVAAICVAIVVLEGWREWVAYDAAVRKVELDTRNLARSMRQHAEDTYEIADQAVSLVSFQLETAGLDDAALRQTEAFMLRTMDSAKRLRGIYVYDADGNWMVTTAADMPAGDNQSTYGYFRAHMNSPSDALSFGAPVRGAENDAMITTVSRRFDKPDGSFGGVVVAAIDARYFADVYDSINVGALGTISLYDSTGRLLSRKPYHPDLLDENLGEGELFEADARAEPSGAHHYDSAIDGHRRIGGFDRGTRYPVVSVVAVSHDEVLADWGRGAVQRGAITLGLTLAAGLLGLRLVEQIRRRQRSEGVLEQKEAEFRLLAESASDLVERFETDGTRTYISPALERLTGYRPADMLGKNAFEVVNPLDRQAVEAAAARLRDGLSEQETVSFRVEHKDGREVWLETSLRIAAERSERLSVVGVTRDITERKHLELQLEGLAMRDGLTGIANRRAFDDALSREVARARRLASPLALLMIDADRFKRFNDDHGHLAGDACLKSIAAVAVMSARRPTDLAARYGGEEMAVLLPDTDIEAARTIAAELCRQVQALAIPHARNLPWRVVTVSIGVAIIDPRDEDAVHDGSWLISTADLALYDAKSQGRNQSVVAPVNTRPPRLVG